MDHQYATLCGLTQVELETTFDTAINELAVVQGKERKPLLDMIKHWYNGYCFEENAPGVYNPYSILSLFRSKKFKNYWFATATPTFLLDLLQRREYDLKRLTDNKVGDRAFDACEPETMGVQSVFLQNRLFDD